MIYVNLKEMRGQAINPLMLPKQKQMGNAQSLLKCVPGHHQQDYWCSWEKIRYAQLGYQDGQLVSLKSILRHCYVKKFLN